MVSTLVPTASRMRVYLALVATLALPGVVLGAQGIPNEPALRRAFEGTPVVVRIDMPGTSDGLDVRSTGQLDPKQHLDRLKRYGIALQAGQRVTVTLIKVKKDLIEFQLNGGGYGTAGDETSTSVDMPDVQKSNREKDLENRVKTEPDTQKKDLQRELDDLRDARERENRRIAVQRSIAEDGKRRMIAARRLEGGSRFNIRYTGVVPPAVSAEDVMSALSAFVDFAAADMPAASRPVGTLRKGQLRAEVERSLGAPVESSERREGALRVVSLVFVRANERVTAEFVEDVLIRYTIVGR